MIGKLEELEVGNLSQRAAAIAFQYGCSDESHYQQWVIDQMLRILLGSEYEEIIKLSENDGEYPWDIGIAP